MAESSKFASIFDAAPPQTDTPAAERNEGRPIGRPPGKRSDPDYKQYSVLLKKQTHRKVSSLLHDRESAQDVSELVEMLLEKWLSEQA